jgi:hypothetical protein
MLCRFCFSHRNFGCFDLVCLIVPSTFVIFPIGITVICNIICLWMGNLYAATPGQNPGVAYISVHISKNPVHMNRVLRSCFPWQGSVRSTAFPLARWRFFRKPPGKPPKQTFEVWKGTEVRIPWGCDVINVFIELDDGKIYRKALYLMVKTMVSCRFSLKPIQWCIDG